MAYEKAVSFLFSQLPSYEHEGSGGYKPGLDTTLRLAEAFGNPHNALKAIHIAGTNGKGSTAHIIASLLQCQGYTVGLYTSPHIADFRERIRIDGEMISRGEVVGFVKRFLASNFNGKPSFFELSTIMAFEHFARHKVGYAVVETGLGGRLDSTNIITPLVSVITSVSLDHMALLGNTTEQIAREKGGIIKPGVPVVVGAVQPVVRDVLETIAKRQNAPIRFAGDVPQVTAYSNDSEGMIAVGTVLYGTLHCSLGGDFQAKNINTALTAIRLISQPTPEQARNALAHVQELTGLTCRWTTLHQRPTVVCDVGHNPGAWKIIVEQLNAMPHEALHIVIAFAADKDVDAMFAMMPKDANYYFTQALTPRAMPSVALREKAMVHGLTGNAYTEPKAACKAAMQRAKRDDLVFVGGSFYIMDEVVRFFGG